MFKLLDGNSPSKKVSCQIEQQGKVATYAATSTRENIVIRDGEGGEVIGGIYVSVRLLKGLDVRTENVEVFGQWEDFEWVVSDKPQPKEATITWDEKAKGVVNKIKGQTYQKLDDISMVRELSFGQGKTLEDYLYENIPVNVLSETHNLEWAKKKKYRILTEDDEIYEWLEGLDKTTEIVGFDTETTGLQVNRTKIDKLVGICMSYEDNAGVYFPIRQERFENVKMGEEKLLELLKPYCHKGSPKAKDLVTHNGGYDWKVLKMYDWELNIVYDTFIRQSIQEISSAKNIYKLKEIVKRVFGIDTVELEDMYVKRSNAEIKEIAKAVNQGSIAVNSITKRKLETAEKQDDLMDFRFASKEFVEMYGPGDADFPRLLHKAMDKEWDEELDFTYRLEISVIPVIGEQEYYGVRAVKEGFEKLHEEAVIKRDKLETLIYEEAGERFNINSYKQLGHVLYDKLKVPKKPKYKTKSGNWGTGASVLKDLAGYKLDNGELRYPIVEYLREYSKVGKLISSFYGKLPTMIVGEHIFAGYRQMGTETGRTSSMRPNLQQTEETSRLYLTTDTDDYYFLICDYSQVEYRIMAGLAGEEKVVNFFANDPEADYHILAYANMMKKPYEDVTPEERSAGKVLNFGTSYGLEDASLAMNLYGDDSMFAQKKANQARREYFDGVPNIRDYFEAKRDEAEEVGYAETLFGRRRVIPEFVRGVNRLNEFRRSSGRRKAGNHPVQGTAADIQKMAMARVRNAFREQGWDESKARLVLNVHDELVGQFHKSINHWYATKVVREAMEMDFSEYGFPPLYIGANLGYNWGDGKDELEAPVYLMDEKIAEIEEMLEKGEELPISDDPRTEWENDIKYFNLRVIKEEMAKGYKDKEDGLTYPINNILDALKNPRLAKYSHYFKNLANTLIFELFDNEPMQVFNKLDTYDNYQSDRSKEALTNIKREILKNNIEDLGSASLNETILVEKNYYGKFDWAVVELLFTKEVEEVYDTLGALIKENKLEPVEYEVHEVKEGKDVTEDLETVTKHVNKKLLRYNKESDTIILKMEHDDMELMQLLESMLVSVTALDLFKEKAKYSLFTVYFADGEKFEISGYVMFRQFAPILRELLIRHVTGRGYKGMENKILTIAGKIILPTKEIDRIERDKLKNMRSQYKRNQTKEGIDEIKRIKQQAMSL